jgi:hypothetical protein
MVGPGPSRGRRCVGKRWQHECELTVVEILRLAGDHMSFAGFSTRVQERCAAG